MYVWMYVCGIVYAASEWSERALSCCRAIYVSVCYVSWRGGGGSLAVFPFLAVGCESAGRRLGLRERSFSRRRREEARAALHHADTQTARTGGENIGAPSSPVCPPPRGLLFVCLSEHGRAYRINKALRFDELTQVSVGARGERARLYYHIMTAVPGFLSLLICFTLAGASSVCQADIQPW